MDKFIKQYEKEVIGYLSGFDRLVLRGTLRALAVKNGGASAQSCSTRRNLQGVDLRFDRRGTLSKL